MIRTLIVAVVFALLSINANAECAKLVFNKYCLGGPISESTEIPEQMEGSPNQYFTRTYSEAFMLWTDDDKNVEIVMKAWGNPSWLKLSRIYSDMVEVYGEPTRDLSHFPKYAKDTESKETAIKLEKGQAVFQWDLELYTVELKWLNRTMISLVYRDSDYTEEDKGL